MAEYLEKDLTEPQRRAYHTIRDHLMAEIDKYNNDPHPRPLTDIQTDLARVLNKYAHHELPLQDIILQIGMKVKDFQGDRDRVFQEFLYPVIFKRRQLQMAQIMDRRAKPKRPKKSSPRTSPTLGTRRRQKSRAPSRRRG